MYSPAQEKNIYPSRIGQWEDAMSFLRLVWYSFADLSLLVCGSPVLAEDTIKLAYTDPFSGPFASGGDEFLKAFQFIIARKNAAGGALGKKFELVPRSE